MSHDGFGRDEPRPDFAAAWRKPQTVRSRLSSPVFAFATISDGLEFVQWLLYGEAILQAPLSAMARARLRADQAKVTPLRRTKAPQDG